jgi:hypothetical protein
MGRLLVFIIIIVAALAGVWFYMPGGQNLLNGAKDKVMSFMPGKADDATVVVEEPVAEDVVVDEVVTEEPVAEDAPASEEAPQN